MVVQDVSAPTNEPSVSQIGDQDMFETSFAMQAMHDSLPVSHLSVDVPILAPTAESYSTSSDIHVPGSFSSVLTKNDKGKARVDIIGDATSNVEVASNSSPIGFTSVDIAHSPSSSQPSHKSKPFTNAANVTPELSTPKAFGPLPSRSLALHPSSLSERKSEPYVDVSTLGRTIISIIMDTEQTSPYGTMEAVSQCEGVHVSVIMDQLMAQDENITPYAVE